MLEELKAEGDRLWRNSVGASGIIPQGNVLRYLFVAAYLGVPAVMLVSRGLVRLQ